jgi:hypothetical protein
MLHNIEDHIVNILSLIETPFHTQDPLPKLYIRLKEFYSLPELRSKKLTKPNLSLYGQLYSPSTNSITETNRFSLLATDPTDPTMDNIIELPSQVDQNNYASNNANTIMPNPKRNADTPTPQESLWVNDTSVTHLSEIIINQLEIDRKNREATGDAEPNNAPQYEDPSFQTIPTVSPLQHMRFNLIRRRDTTSDTTTLKLFKSFIHTLRDIDANINILPYEAAKHHISPLTNGRQVNEVDDNKLQLYFRPYHKKQHYSLSGYFHIGTTLEAEALFSNPKMLEWLDSYRYYIKLSPSQTEEMIQIGALLFSSIYIYRADLKLSIMKHPLWQPKDTENTPVFELFTSDLIASDKKARMIFVSAEKTKTDEVAALFRTIYDGKPKSYPNGAMMLFVPLNEDINYTVEYRKKLIFNHESFIGKEDAITINGLNNLNNEVTLKNGEKITIRMLLKSLPASQGMSRPQLFQFVEPNNSGVTTLATFQTQDKSHVETRKCTLEAELRSIVLSSDLEKLFLSVTDGIWSGGITKNKGGKIIPTKPPNPQTQQHLNQISSILRSPPEKKSTTQDLPNSSAPNTRHHYTIAHKPMTPPVPPQPTHNEQPRNFVSHDSPLLTKIDQRFSLIENTIQKHQEYNETFHNRLLNLEQTTQNTDHKIDMILNKMEAIANPPKLRKVSFHPELSAHDQEMTENSHPNSQQQIQNTGCNQQCIM